MEDLGIGNLWFATVIVFERWDGSGWTSLSRRFRHRSYIELQTTSPPRTALFPAFHRYQLACVTSLYENTFKLHASQPERLGSPVWYERLQLCIHFPKLLSKSKLPGSSQRTPNDHSSASKVADHSWNTLLGSSVRVRKICDRPESECEARLR